MKNKTLSIIPQQEHGLIAEVTSSKIDILGKIDIPYNSISKITNNTIVTLDRDNKKIILHTIDGSHIKSIRVPFGLAMNVKGSVVYVGGNARTGEVCYKIDLSNEEPTLENINLPIDMGWGKAVDDILIVGDKMLLIDDLVFPKYTFEYDISTPNKPIWVETIELPHGRAYEHITKGDMNEDWMIYLSTASGGWTDDKAHITIEGKHCNTISSSSSKKASILDICLVGDKLYALTDIGLGVFDLNEPELYMGSIRFIDHQIVAGRIIKVDEKKLILVSKYSYELLDLEKLDYFDGGTEEKFWSYGSLNLSDRELTAFPEEKIKHLEKLEYLNLSGNEIKELPEALKRCKQLRSLNLYSSGITEIPSWIERFDKMEYLNLSGIDIGISRIFKFNRISFPKNLKILNLRYCQLLRIPPEVFKLKELEYLNLKENLILWIPGKIGKLKNLKTLKIDWGLPYVSKQMGELKKMHSLKMDSNFRGKMPKFIYHMKQLKRLDASSADICEIAPDIKNLVDLEYFDLSRNYDLGIPDEFGDLKNLRVLNLSLCGLQKIPQSIHNLTKLEVLDLSYNHLMELKEEDFADMKSLRKLDLYHNEEKEPEIEVPEEAKRKKPIFRLPKYQIFGYKSWMIALWDWAKANDISDYEWSELGGGNWSGFPKDKRELEEFKEFSLSYSQFTELPKEIGHLVNLTKIDLRNSNLETLPIEIGNLANLTKLDFYKSKLKKLPDEIGKLVNLRELLLCDNVLTELPKEIGNLVNLTELDVSYNRLTELPKEIGNLANLRRLDVGGRTQLKYLPREIGNLKNLIELDVSYNQLVGLPKEIGNLVNLKELWVEGNQLAELPDLGKLIHLTQLRLGNNQLTKLPKRIENLENLIWLDLQDNELKSLPAEITGLSKLETLSLGENENLVLTDNQTVWIDKLKENGCDVRFNDGFYFETLD